MNENKPHGAERAALKIAYCVGAAILLLGQDDGAGSLSCVEGSSPFDNSLALSSAATGSNSTANAGDTVPFVVGHGHGFTRRTKVLRALPTIV